MDTANTTRGELSLRLGEITYTLKPEHERAVRLDDALEHGIMGTLVRVTEERVIKLRDMALIVACLADDVPSLPELERAIFDEGTYVVSSYTTRALVACAAGTHDPGEGDGQPS